MQTHTPGAQQAQQQQQGQRCGAFCPLALKGTPQAPFY